MSILGLYNDISILMEEIKENKPDIVFNMVEVCNDQSHLDKNIAALLEILDIPYTGASTGSLFVCNNKALCKKILVFHRIKVPRFYTFLRKRRVYMPAKLKLPTIIKPLSEEASRGISPVSYTHLAAMFLSRCDWSLKTSTMLKTISGLFSLISSIRMEMSL